MVEKDFFVIFANRKSFDTGVSNEKLFATFSLVFDHFFCFSSDVRGQCPDSVRTKADKSAPEHTFFPKSGLSGHLCSVTLMDPQFWEIWCQRETVCSVHAFSFLGAIKKKCMMISPELFCPMWIHNDVIDV